MATRSNQPAPYGTTTVHACNLADFIATDNRQRKEVKYRRATPSMRARQVQGSLDRLASAKHLLLGREPAVGRGAVRLNIEHGPLSDRDQRTWRMPAAQENRVSIPIEFFTNGWVQVLTDSEIAGWLMFRDWGNLNSPDRTGYSNLELYADDRLGWYDQSRDVWDTHTMLSRMGLMSSITFAYEAAAGGQPARRHGSLFSVHDQALKTSARNAVWRAVDAERAAAEMRVR